MIHEPIPQVITSGTIARELKAPRDRVLRILATRPHISPAARAGKVRLYPAAAIAQVRHELNAIDARQHSAAQPPEQPEAANG